MVHRYSKTANTEPIWYEMARLALIQNRESLLMWRHNTYLYDIYEGNKKEEGGLCNEKNIYMSAFYDSFVCIGLYGCRELS